MPKTLIINSGSSSLKWQLYEMPEEKVIAKGIFERVGLNDSIISLKFGEIKEEDIYDVKTHTDAVSILLDNMKRLKIVEDFNEITGIGHRVVAGGEYFSESTLIDDDVLEKIESLSPLAPLHNPANAAGIRAFKELLPDAVAVAVFDTAFHTTMPAKAYRYPLPKKYYTDYAVRKYGAHGTSHEYVAKEAAKLLGKDIKDTKIITAHIGNGASITAVKAGQSVDTSMGFTPLAGLMMGTRTGEMDASVFPYLIEKDPELNNAQDVVDMMNKKSGLLGVSGISSDMRDVESNIETNPEAKLAFEMYVDRVQKYIGQYLAVLNGADAIVFTAGVGENGNYFRAEVMKAFEFLNVRIDPSKNIHGNFGDISTEDSAIKVLVIPTDEELVITRDVERLK
ncbi:MAG: acetate kinase [Lactovum sp.]